MNQRQQYGKNTTQMEQHITVRTPAMFLSSYHKNTSGVIASEKHPRKESQALLWSVFNTPPELYLLVELHWTWYRRKWKTVSSTAKKYVLTICAYQVYTYGLERKLRTQMVRQYTMVAVVMLQTFLAVYSWQASQSLRNKSVENIYDVRKTRPLNWMLQCRDTKIVHVWWLKIGSRYE